MWGWLPPAWSLADWPPSSSGRLPKTIVQVDPTGGKDFASQITAYDLPAGYQERSGIIITTLKSAVITDRSGQNAIYLLQGLEGNFLTPDRFLNKSLNMEHDEDPIVWTAVETVPVQIRGQATDLMAFDGLSKAGVKFRALSALFAGKEGPALVAVVSPAETWDEVVAQAFIDSLR
ncbi:MAG: hypothetical protein AB9891_05790 [Anaerolineaceae bacterium]